MKEGRGKGRGERERKRKSIIQDGGYLPGKHRRGLPTVHWVGGVVLLVFIL